MPILGHYVPFNRQNVLGITTEEGVYELYQGHETIFLGSSDDDTMGIRGMLERHLHGEFGECSASADDFRFEVNSRPERRLEELLEEYEKEHGVLPRCNQALVGSA
jgi:hypothetical protein